MEINKLYITFRSTDGEGNFNWRFVFDFDYLTAERRIVVKRKEHFWSVDETEMKFAPVLVVQVWDNDQFSADDFLGQVELNLTAVPKPAKDSSNCKLSLLPAYAKDGAHVQLGNLFAQKRLRGFWPVAGDESGGSNMELTGKVELELELLTDEDAKARPAGIGREDPNANPFLEPPDRPETSFNPMLSPLKVLGSMWHRFKYRLLCSLFIILFILLFLIALYSLPVIFLNIIFLYHPLY